MTVEGMDRVIARLERLAQRFPDEVGNALRAEAEIEMTEAKKRTPVKTGALRGSGHVTGPERSWRDIAVVLSFGGPAAPYAVRVHEDLTAFHRVGQAKFLESVLRESEPYMAARVAHRIDLMRLL
jgi:hypothetical protein